MAINSEQLNNKYIVCPKCLGSGKNDLGFACSNCGGIGLGIFYHRFFLFWGLVLSRTIIEMSFLRKKIRQILKFSAYFFSFLGLFSFLTWIFLMIQEDDLQTIFVFFKIKSPFLLFFWISCFFFMFLIYLNVEKKRKEHQLKFFSYGHKKRNIVEMNNWDDLKKANKDSKINVFLGYNQAAVQVVEQSFLFASQMNHPKIEPLHIFFNSLVDKQVLAIFSRLNIDSEKLFLKVKKYLLKINQKKGKVVLSNNSKKVLIDAYTQACELEHKKVTPKNFLISCLKNDNLLKEILYDFGIDEKKIYNVILWFTVNEKMVENYQLYRKAARFKPGKTMDRAYTAIATPLLNHFSYDLTAAAKWGRLEYCVAREAEIKNIFESFESGFHGVVLTGPSGVGKNSIINGVAQAMVREEVPRFLQDKRLLELDVSRLVSGVNPAQAQGRMMAMMDEIERAGNIVLFMKNIDSIIGIQSSEEGLDLADVLASILERKVIYCIATAQDNNYKQFIEGGFLSELMSQIIVVEPKGDQAIQIVESKISYLEGKYKVYFSYIAIEAVIELSQRYIHEKYLPEKAIQILEKVAVRVAKNKGDQSIVSVDDVSEIISDMVHIPITKISASEKEDLLQLEQKIHQRVIGQDEAVDEVAASLRRARTQVRENKRPIASFLFLGPTGVGKTELAKAVTDIYFGDKKYMIRVDMSEYQHQDSVNKMIGGAGKKGFLTEAVRKTPFALILLDEFEKAHADIFNLFLQVMDDGILTDGSGQTIDFTNTIIIATSNVGALYIQKEVFDGTDVEEIKKVLLNEHLNKVIRPELINRFDGITVFEPLSFANMIEITRLMIKDIEKMLGEKGINFEISEKALSILAKKAYDPKFGARSLRRLLQDDIENEIANKILKGELTRRDTLVIDADANVWVEKAKEL